MNSSPRVLLCCEHYPPSVGGVQEVMRQIAERLAADGVDVTVATSPHSSRPIDTLRNGVRVVSFPITGNWARGMEGPVDAYQAFLQQGGFDALLIKAAQQWTFDAAIDVFPELRCRKLFIPCGFSGLHNPLYATYFQKMPQWLRQMDGLIFYANEYQDIAFAREHGLESLHLIPNGVDEREFADTNEHDIRQRMGIALDNDLILGVGSRISSKGHWEVLNAFFKADLRRPTTLVINANPPGGALSVALKRNLKHVVTGRLPLPWLAWWCNVSRKSKRVKIVDMSRKDLVDLYKAADLFVNVSHIEYSPLVLFEAAAAGTPFIASSAGNSEEIACWIRGGVVLPRVNNHSAKVSIDSVAREMENLLIDKEKLIAIGIAARVDVWSKGFIWSEIVKRYRQILIAR